MMATGNACKKSMAPRVLLRRFADDCLGQKIEERPSASIDPRSEEHTSELQSHSDLVCRLLLEKKKERAARYDRRGRTLSTPNIHNIAKSKTTTASFGTTRLLRRIVCGLDLSMQSISRTNSGTR